MSDNRCLRVVARWLSILMLATILCPRVPARAADAPEATSSVKKTGAVVVDTANNQIVISAGERDGIVKDTVFRITRAGQEVSQVKVFETSFATSNARVVSGAAVPQIRLNDRAEVVETPVVRARSGFKFPWGIVAGVGVIALVVMGAVRKKSDGRAATPTGTTGGVADITLD